MNKMKMPKDKIISLALLILVAAISSTVIFNRLGSTTIWAWDEARRAENALEILKSGEWVILQYGGEPDMWNLKPPLPAWLIAISFKIFGINEFALRFWSALLGVGTIAIVFLFGTEMKNRYVGLYAALILLSTKGFIGYHTARTGDCDVMVTFFLTLSLYLFYLNQKRRYLLFTIGAAASMALGFLVKGLIILVPVIIGLYLLYSKSLKKALFSREAKYATATFLIISAPWFILRFIGGREFFIRKIQYDIIYRFGTAIEGHTGDWYYYFTNLQSRGLGWILLSLFIAAFIYSLYLFKKKDKAVSLLMIWICLFLFILSLIKTKIFWYLVPVYPAISLLIAYNIEAIKEAFRIKRIIVMLLFLLLITPPFISIVKYTNKVYISRRAKAIKDLREGLSEVNDIFIHKDENNQAIFFYLNASVAGETRIYDEDLAELELRTGDAVITFDKHKSSILLANRDYRLIAANQTAGLFGKR